MLRERVGDLKDVEIRVLTLLLDLPGSRSGRSARRARTRFSSRTTSRRASRCSSIARRSPAIATDAGTRTSHVAILARSLGLAGDRRAAHGDAAADGPRDGDPRRIDRACSRSIRRTHDIDVVPRARAAGGARRSGAAPPRRRSTRSRPTACASRCARTSISPKRRSSRATSGAEGVGLMRTEFLVVGRATMPDEDEQYRAYKRVVEGVRRTARS